MESWQPGEQITLRGEHWTVAACTFYSDCQALRVEADRDRRARTFLLPFDRPQRVRSNRLVVVSPRAWFHQFKALLAESFPYGGLCNCPDAIDLLPYQLEPAIAMLREGHPRLLIADEVGLGKTIEAGLILKELAARQEDFRAIILVPAGLRQQWREEFATRFGLEPIFADASWLREAERSLPADINPWSLPGIYVSSFDLVKRPEALRPLEDVRWDLVVLDEAHGATLSTDRRAAVDAIAVRSHRVILLTATPPGDPAQFAALCRIGSLSEDTDIPMFQRGRNIHPARARRSVALPVTLTDEEQRMHRVLERYTQLLWRERTPEGRLVSITLRKRALSSASALERSLRRRQELLSGIVARPEQQLLLPLPDDEDTREDAVPDELLGSWRMADRATEERALLESIVAAACAARNESKARVLLKFLSRIREPAIVFTEYRDTLTWLHARLNERHIRTCVLHGGMTAAERRTALTEFRRGTAMLLATDAAAEGLNLHQRCRSVVHYEVPWNPARMLQRAGRVDRMGQTRRVHEIALVAADTSEALVIAPFARRAAAWSDARGRASLEWLTESRMAEAVFEAIEAPPEIICGSQRAGVSLDLRADGSEEARRLEARRVLVASRTSTMSTPTGGMPCAILRRSTLPPGLVLVFELSVLLAREIVEQSILALHCGAIRRLHSRKVSHLRARIVEILPDIMSAVAPVTTRIASDRVESIRTKVTEATTRRYTRARLLHQMHESAARQLVQIGLFDRRRSQAASLEHSPLFGPRHVDPMPDLAPDVTCSADLRALLLIPLR